MNRSLPIGLPWQPRRPGSAVQGSVYHKLRSSMKYLSQEAKPASLTFGFQGGLVVGQIHVPLLHVMRWQPHALAAEQGDEQRLGVGELDGEGEVIRRRSRWPAWPGYRWPSSRSRPPGVRVLFSIQFSYHHLTSAVVKGLPSDHLVPLRRLKVHSVPSALTFQDFGQAGLHRPGSYRTRPDPCRSTWWGPSGPKRPCKRAGSCRRACRRFPGSGQPTDFRAGACQPAGSLPSLTS